MNLGALLTAENARWMRDRVRGASAQLRAQLVLRDCELGKRVHCFGDMRLTIEGRVKLGDGVFFLDGYLPHELVAHAGSEIEIGDGSGFNHGVSLEAHQRITIGKRCLFGSLVRICDCARGRVAPITIGDDVWIAHGAILEPGITIGSGSAVSAGSVVVNDVPPHKLAIGNPARSVPLDLRHG